MGYPTRILTPEKALARLQALCAKAEHSEGEVRDKLRRWGIAPIDAEKVMLRLKEDRYVDDRRFARAYVLDKVRFARWGRRKVALGLVAKRVDRDIADDALAAIDIDEYAESLTHVLSAKVRQDSELIDTYEGRTKLYRFALGRGFEPDLISKAIKQLMAKARD